MKDVILQFAAARGGNVPLSDPEVAGALAALLEAHLHPAPPAPAEPAPAPPETGD